MKIEKPYTSKQFGLYLKSLTTSEFCKLSGAEEPRFRPDWTTEQNALYFMRIDAIKLRLRDDYDKFLNQKPSKEMYINEIPMPDYQEYALACFKESVFDEDYKKWKEAENKIIFPGFKITNKKDGSIILNKDSKCEILISQHETVYINDGYCYVALKSIEDFIIKSEVKLEIKPFEL